MYLPKKGDQEMNKKVTRKIAVSFVLLAIALGVMANLSGVFMANTSAEDAGADGGDSNLEVSSSVERSLQHDGRIDTPASYEEIFYLGDKIVTPT
jgi:hypothetical protein